MFSQPKRFKAASQETPSTSRTFAADLESFQQEIQRIRKGAPTRNEEIESGIRVEHDYESHQQENENPLNCRDDLKKFIREQIRLSERRIQQRLESIEQKINRLLETQLAVAPQDVTQEPSEFDAEEQVTVVTVDPRDLDSQLFPIQDETTFDWFFDRLKDCEYRNALIERRWQLTHHVSTKSCNSSVKDFLKMHFELPVVVKYSCSGFGARGTPKKKLDSKTLAIYVYECFYRSVNGYSFPDISKAIVSFWGRASDYLNKNNERALKKEVTILYKT